MALSATEVWSNGFVRDTATQAIIVTTDDTDARWWNGQLRDPDGRLVVESV